jgi:hypothetical protein
VRLARWIPIAVLCVVLPALAAGAARTPKASWTATSKSSFQGFQSTCTGSASSSVGSHTCDSFSVPGCTGFCMDGRVWADSTGNVHHKSRAEAVVSVANSGVVAGTSRIYDVDIYIPSATNSTKVCGWHNLFQFATGLQFAGPRLELIARNGTLDLGVSMWTGTAAAAKGMVGVHPADLGPAPLDRWFHVTETVTWSPTKGAVTFTVAGKMLFARSNVQTQPSDLVKQYWKLGPYEGDGCAAEAWYGNPRVS